MQVSDLKVCVVGLGYVGLPLAVEFGLSIDVLGFDIDVERIDELRAGVDRTREVESADLAASTGLSFTSELSDIADRNCFIVTVPTPIDIEKNPDLTPLISASKAIGSVLKKNDLVIYESTVFPGCTEEVCVPVLEEVSGLKFNRDFFCGYSPERINPGDRVNTLRTVIKVTSGSTEDIARIVDQLYNIVVDAGTHLAPSIKVAEAAKVIENTQRDLNIAFVNELSTIFERMDIDTLEVLEAAGTKWNFLPFRPGLVGGHCIGVDPYYLAYKAEQLGCHPQVIFVSRQMNEKMAHHVATSLVKTMTAHAMDLPNTRVAVLGITFKENCPDIRNSKVFDLIEELKSWQLEVVAADPWADRNEVSTEYGIELVAMEELAGAVDVLVVAVGHNEFREFTAQDLRGFYKGDKPIIGDLKSIYDRQELLASGFQVFRL